MITSDWPPVTPKLLTVCCQSWSLLGTAMIPPPFHRDKYIIVLLRYRETGWLIWSWVAAMSPHHFCKLSWVNNSFSNIMLVAINFPPVKPQTMQRHCCCGCYHLIRCSVWKELSPLSLTGIMFPFLFFCFFFFQKWHFPPGHRERLWPQAPV